MLDVENMMCKVNFHNTSHKRVLHDKPERCLCDLSVSSLISERFLKGTCSICGHALAREGTDQMHGFRCHYCHCHQFKREKQPDLQCCKWDTSLRSLDDSQRSIIHRGVDSDDVTDSIIENGDVQKSLGNYTAALQEYQAALTMQQKSNANPHKQLNMARTFHKLGVVHGKLGDFDLAHNYLEKSLGIKYCSYGVDSRNEDILSTLIKLGNLYLDHHHFDDAKYMYDEVLKCQLELYAVSSVHKALTCTYSKLGKILSALGRFEEAQDQYETILTLLRKEHGDGFINYDIASALHNLGILARERGQFQVALRRTQESIEMQRLLTVHSEASATDETDLAGSLSSLGAIHYDMDNFTESQKCYEDALKTLRRAHVEDASKDADMARMLFNIGMLYEKLDCKSSARLKYNEALQKMKSDATGTASDTSKSSEVPPIMGKITERLRLLCPQQPNLCTT